MRQSANGRGTARQHRFLGGHFGERIAAVHHSNTVQPRQDGSGGTLIEIKHISKAFAGNLALDDVSFNIEPGRIHALVGENGSGKSTLIKILAGYYAPSSDASVTVDGRAMTMASVQASQKLGLRFVHQRSSLINEMSATDNIALAVGYVRHQSGRIDWKGSSRQASDLLASLDVELDTSRPVGLHREVDRSSIAIARAIGLPGSDVRCIALDEPTSRASARGSKHAQGSHPSSRRLGCLNSLCVAQACRDSGYGHRSHCPEGRQTCLQRSH